jgi:adenosylmethionine-8-amino-7-oxononanoate aminotransferase
LKIKKTGKSYDYKLKIGTKICTKMRKKGVIIRNLGDTLVLFLPLTITEKEISYVVDSIREEIKYL